MKVEKKSWDQKAIESIYENLLNELGELLDLVNLIGCDSFLKNAPSLQLYLKLIEQMEQELLLQWNIKQQDGLPLLFERHKRWCNQELRNRDGFFKKWNQFCLTLWQFIERPEHRLDQSPWKSLLLSILFNKESWRPLRGALITDQKKSLINRICQLFEKLFLYDPHHQMLSFLNIQEIGTGTRPEIHQPGIITKESLAPPNSSLAKTVGIKKEEPVNWEIIASRVSQFLDEPTSKHEPIEASEGDKD